MNPGILGRVTAGVAVAVSIVLLAGTPAAAEPGQASLNDVIATLGVGPKPSDYVISVDISGSMADQGRWATVKKSLAALAGTLLPKDHVSLVTFGKTATVEFDGLAGDNPQQLVKALPAVPNGEASDIGLGISAGLDQLERPQANEVAAFVLVTDGEHRADAGSPYDLVGSAAWQDLRTRADKLVAGRPIAAYAVALAKGADAKLLRQVFTKVTDVPATQVTKQFGRLDTDLVKVQAADALRPDLGEGVTATWSQPFTDLGTSGTRKAELTLTSTTKSVPLTVSNLSLVAGPVQLSAAGLPAVVELAPGASQTIPVELSWVGPGTGQLQVNGTVTSAWQDVITKDLGLDFAPTVTGSTTLAAAEPLDLAPVLPWLLSALVIALLGIAAWWAHRITRPELVGSLSFSVRGTVSDETMLTGRRIKLDGRAAAEGTGAKLTGTVSGVRRKDEHGSPETGVLVKARLGDDRVKAQLFDGESVTLGDTEITYTTVRSRMIALITS